MEITDYLNEIRHAVETVISDLHHENDEVLRLHKELEKLNAATIDGYERADFLARNPDLDDEGLGTLMHWDTYFGPDKDRYHKQHETDAARQKLEAHQISIAALAGSLLQFAKQGISIKYGPEKIGCPEGRLINAIELREVIWHGRNQSLHWEEGEFRKPVTQCFERLINVDPVFSGYKTKNMAYEIVKYLQWKNFTDFEGDMMLLQ